AVRRKRARASARRCPRWPEARGCGSSGCAPVAQAQGGGARKPRSPERGGLPAPRVLANAATGPRAGGASLLLLVFLFVGGGHRVLALLQVGVEPGQLAAVLLDVLGAPGRLLAQSVLEALLQVVVEAQG